MIIFDRRVILSAGIAGAAFGLSKAIELFPSAFAQGTAASPMNPAGMAFYRFTVGDIEVTTVFDGAITRDHNPGFIKNASIDDTRAALRAAKLPDDKLPNTYTVTFVKLGGRTIMFDAGNGAGGAAGTGLLAANMKAAGIDPASVGTIIVTHFHPDHIYGLMAGDNAQVYPNAEVIVPEAEYKFWADPSVITRLPEARQGIAKRVQATMPNWKNLTQIAAGKEPVPGISALQTHGHSPGHTSYLMSSGNAQFLVLGDVTNIPAINLANPGWQVMFDQDGPMAEATRRRTLDRVVADKITCTGYHWGMPGAGTVTKDGGGYALVPVA